MVLASKPVASPCLGRPASWVPGIGLDGEKEFDAIGRFEQLYRVERCIHRAYAVKNARHTNPTAPDALLHVETGLRASR